NLNSAGAVPAGRKGMGAMSAPTNTERKCSQIRSTASGPSKSDLRKFRALAQREPRLMAMSKHLTSPALKNLRRTSRRFCGNDLWLNHSAPRLERLVGLERPDGDSELSSWGAFQVCNAVLYHLLPACKNCMC